MSTNSDDTMANYMTPDSKATYNPNIRNPNTRDPNIHDHVPNAFHDPNIRDPNDPHDHDPNDLHDHDPNDLHDHDSNDLRDPLHDRVVLHKPMSLQAQEL
jgi:hypothetical protein